MSRRGRGGDGYLEIEVLRLEPNRVQVEVEVATFYPAIRLTPRPVAVREHAVAHPRDRHTRVPALTGQAGPGRVARGQDPAEVAAEAAAEANADAKIS